MQMNTGLKIKLYFYVILQLIFSNVIIGQTLEWSKVETTQQFGKYIGQTEIAGLKELVYLNGGKLYHAHIDSNFQVQVIPIENQVTGVDHFVMCDVDWDGDLDILAVVKDAPIQVYEKVDKTFKYNVRINLLNGLKIKFLSVHDYNDDGHGDLYANLDLYVAEGPNVFKRKHSSISDTYVPVGPQFYDFEGDGDKDLLLQIVTNLFIYKNTGAFSLFEIGVTNFQHNTSWARVIKVGNKNEVIIYSGGIEHKLYRLIYENGIFDKKEIGTLYSHSPIVHDLNGDGNEDIIINQQYNNLVYIQYHPDLDTLTFHSYEAKNLLGFCTEKFAPNTIYVRYKDKIEGVQWDEQQKKLTTRFSSNPIFSPNQFLDVDGDGFVDLIQDRIIVRYRGENLFDKQISMNIDSTDGIWNDFDGDKDLDYVLKSGWFQNIGNLVFDNYKPRTPDPIFMDPVIHLTNIVFREDIDEDGDIDVLTYNRFDEPFKLYENNNGVFTLKQVLAKSSIINGYLRGLHFVDLDGDGLRDILIAAASGMVWMKSEGGLVFSEAKVLYKDTYSPLSVDVSDINGDGISDILLSTGEIIAGASKGSIYIYLGTLNGAPKAHEVTKGDGYHRAKFANLNKTGLKDIIFTNDLGIFEVQLENLDEFKTEQIYFNQKSGYVFQILDLDGDGDDDILTANYINDSIYLINGAFSNPDCPEGGVYLRNQEQVYDFVTNYGRCQVINGDLHFGPVTNTTSNIFDISGMVNIQKIEGDLFFKNVTMLNDFEGFSALDTILGSLTLNQFAAKKLHGFEKLKYIGDNLNLLHVANNDSYELDTKELSNVQFVGGNINLSSQAFINLGIQSQEVYYGDIIFNNVTRLNNINFLEKTKEIKGKLLLGNCAITTLEPAKNLTKVDELIVKSSLLQTLAMGSNIDSIHGSLTINGNGQYELFDDSSFVNLKHVGNSLELFAKSLKGFSNVGKVMGSLSISTMPIEKGFLEEIYFIGKNLFMEKVPSVYPEFLQNVDSIPGYINLLANNFSDLSFLSSIKKAGSLDINQNFKITSLKELRPDLELNGRLLISRNPKLNFCDVPFVCAHIQAGKLIYIQKNGTQCSDIADLVCRSNAFSGKVYYDSNRNGTQDIDEYIIKGQNVVAYNKPTVITSNAGVYHIYCKPNDSLDVSILDENKFIITTQPEQYRGSFMPDLASNGGNDFGLVHKSQNHNVNVKGQTGLFICNRAFVWDLQVINEGSFIEKNRIEIQLPIGIKVDSIIGSEYVYNESTGILSMEIDILYPFQIFHPKIWMTAPAWNPSGINLHELRCTLYAYNNWGEKVLVQNYSENLELLCSYDPNDKIVTGPYKKSNLLFGKSDYLEYIIRFQNTGNYYAENVLLVDTLSSFLNLDSLEILMSSHEPVEITQKNNILKFYFPNIMLPDSTRDFTGSQGYVRFRIKTKEGMSANDEIKNTGHIYFDYNEPIVTNTVTSFVLLPDFSQVTSKDQLTIFPIPSTDKIWIKLNETNLDENWETNVFSSLGIKYPVHFSSNDDFMNVSNLPSGVYILLLENKINGKRISRVFTKI